MAGDPVKYSVREVDGAEECEVILSLAKIILPCDDPPNPVNGYWWLAYYGDVAVGFAGLDYAKTDSDAMFLCLAGVVPEHRGHGLQRALIKARVNKTRRLGKRRAISYTMLNNVGSSNNLIAVGFRMYEPPFKFHGGGVCYWKREIPTTEL